MTRKILLASHSKMAAGLKKTLEFIAGEQKDVDVLTAYVDGQPIEDKIKAYFDSCAESDEVFVFTDMMAGSVNQKFVPYIKRPHTHLITGMNLEIVLAITLEQSNMYLAGQRIEDLIQEARQKLQYVNTLVSESIDDEDE